jgi:cytochrome c-type biogenesis protein CcmH
VRRAAAATLLALVLVLVPQAWASESHPTLAEMESRVMCPVCKTTLDQSDSAVAQRIEAVISQKIAAGETRSRIESDLVAQFGPAILAAPPRRGFDLLAWWLPIVGVIAGGLMLGVAAWHWSRVRDREAVPAPLGATSAGPLDPELERRLDEELRRLDG